ncbi:MAG: M48 family metallopeptidase, partial [Rhodospirillales bacterium]
MARRTVQETAVELRGRPVPVRLQRNPRARRIILRIDAHGTDADGVAVTLPRGAKPAEGLALVREKADWVLGRLGALRPRVPFEPGEAVPVLGRERVIRPVAPGRGVVRLEETEILVAGRPEHLARRVRDWLKAEARREIMPLVRDKAAALGRRPGRVTIRDTRSRWGSCSAEGNLSFCWRLVMAPVAVLDYVVA